MSLDTLPSVPVHPTEDLLEEYSFGRVSEPDLTPFEEHLLDCTLCQARLLAIDEYTALMKAGITALERERKVSRPSPHFAFPGIAGHHVVLAAASLLLLVSVTISWRQPLPLAASPAALVKLIALRGGEGDGVTRAPSGSPLELIVDRTDLPPAFSYRLEVVSSTGRTIWSETAEITQQNISARVTTPLSRGVYWVRLYSAGDPARGGQLRREFGLHIE